MKKGITMTRAFTMAEILLSLTIIGVVAAITLPSLTGNINERTWNTQRKALYARFSQALALMPNLNGYGTVTEGVAADATAGTSAVDPVDTAAETFITNGLSKVMKINNICGADNLEDCGIPTTVTTVNGDNLSDFTTSYNTLVKFNNLFTSANSYNTPDTKAAAFETGNGESIVVYYNPQCQPNMNETKQHATQTKMCANFVYDLNGNKGPNTVGKDIGFMTALYSSDPAVVAPLVLTRNAGIGGIIHRVAGEECKKQDEESRLPTSDELAAIFCNKTLVNISGNYYWSSSQVPTDKAWLIHFNTGLRYTNPRGINYLVRCVKR